MPEIAGHGKQLGIGFRAVSDNLKEPAFLGSGYGENGAILAVETPAQTIGLTKDSDRNELLERTLLRKAHDGQVPGGSLLRGRQLHQGGRWGEKPLASALPFQFGHAELRLAKCEQRP